MSLMESIRNFVTPKGSVSVWWFGQNGFIFKSEDGTLLSIDLYLSDCVPKLLPDLPVNLSRKLPVFMDPSELVTDVYACTHSHYDHTDPETIRNLRNKDVIQFVGPPITCKAFREYGVEDSRILSIWPGEEIEFRDIMIRGAFALPTDTSDLNHVGFIVDFGGKIRIYLTGDTDHCELLAEAAQHSPHVLIPCINGNFNNLSHWEAAEVAHWVKPKIAIPCHYDMFPDNSMDPRQFRASLKIRAPEVQYFEMRHVEPYTFAF